MSEDFDRQFRISELKGARDFHKAQCRAIERKLLEESPELQFHKTQLQVLKEKLMEFSCDPEHCREPWECAGLGHCPLEYACND